jgi:hypothetical protein
MCNDIEGEFNQLEVIKKLQNHEWRIKSKDRANRAPAHVR